ESVAVGLGRHAGLEHALDEILRHTAAVIDDLQLDGVHDAAQHDLDATLRRRGIDRVLQQIDEHLLDLAWIAADGGLALGIDRELDLALAGQTLVQLDDLTDELAELHLAHRERRERAREVEELVEDALHAIDL